MPLVELDIAKWLENLPKFDAVIDARSPKEFNYSHIPGALNLAALNDKEHQEIGTIYKTNRAYAKALGASYICANLQGIIAKIYANHRVGAQIGIYCAKGGMRSLSIAMVLGMIGYRVVRLEGGYKAFRAHVLDFLNDNLKTRFITLFGNTGCSKTKLIRALDPALDIEKLANHLGSVFGALLGAQPSQKQFEDNLFFELKKLSGEVVFAEGESRRVGSLTIPASLHEALRAGLCVEVKASLNKRVECIMSDYKDINSSFFYECISKISPFISREAKMDAIRAFETEDIAKVAEILLVKYYDKVYKKPNHIDATISSDDFNEAVNQLIEIREKLL